MITLYLDSSLPNKIMVKVLQDGHDLAKASEEQSRGSQVLLKLLQQSLKKACLNFSDLDNIEVNIGPGSYTGLKVGAAVAQSLGFALKIPVNRQVNKPVELRYT